MNKTSLMAAVAITLAFAACKKNDMGSSGNQGNQPIAPDNFSFSTSKEVSLDIKLLTNDDMPIDGVLVNVYAPGSDAVLLYTAVTDKNGSINAKLNIAAYIDTLVVDPAYIGLMRNAKTAINGSSSSCIIGGADGYGGNVVPSTDLAGGTTRQKTSVAYGSSYVPAIEYLGKYNSNGRPNNREKSDVISSTLLSNINASLPESHPVPTYHPDYLNADASTSLNVVKKADVWITFVSEGAGYMNSLGFYTYPTNQPPASINDVKTITVAIPNASLSGSGGAMMSGDKIYLGQFNAGTSIGFVLLQNAWNESQDKVNSDAKLFFADENLNTGVESADYLRHTVLLWDETNKLFLQGFEDLQRDNQSSDEDFNDLVFYTTSNPVDAISSDKMNPIDKPIDGDGDGVSDVYDKYPKDATRAYVQYFPSKEGWGTLAFEDLWPSTGDYDLNDLVTGYHYTFIKNGSNKTVEMYGDYNIRAIGASFANGFGIQLPVASSAVSTVTGQKLKANYISLNANGTEAKQTKAVIIPFDDTRALFPSGGFTNVYTGQSAQVSDTSHVYVKFASAVADADLGVAPYNPFLISSQRRGYEVHLPGNAPTGLADLSLFGTKDDNSIPTKSRYYLNANNWPWALSFTEKFDYPTETSNIANAYLNFLTWAKSGGTVNTDWYKHIPANVNEKYIYAK